VKTISHRRAPQGTEAVHEFSVICGDLCGYSSISPVTSAARSRPCPRLPFWRSLSRRAEATPPRRSRAWPWSPRVGRHLRAGVGRHIEAPRYWYCCGL